MRTVLLVLAVASAPFVIAVSTSEGNCPCTRYKTHTRKVLECTKSYSRYCDVYEWRERTTSYCAERAACAESERSVWNP